MKIIDVYNSSLKPELYQKGNSDMWRDKYISQQLLNIHLDTNIDLGSRKTLSIRNTVDWILENSDKKKFNILDLGCGPGLYAELFTEKGHKVTGVDFSKNSIEYARKEAEKKNLDIEYINEDYLKLELEENKFDLVILIYTDFGVLLPSERDRLLNLISKVLKPNGVFVFDVLNNKNIENKITQKNWEVVEKGFWKNRPYLALSESFLYKEQKVILYQHTVLTDKEKINVYRFWTHFFSHTDIAEVLMKHPFGDLNFNEDVLPNGDLWNGDNVTFCTAINLK